MRQTSAWFLLAALSLATPSLRADGTAPTPAPAPAIKQSDITRARLSLQFDQPMLTWGTPSSSAMLQLSPAVECAWYWEDDVTLVCDRDRVAGQAEDFGQAQPFKLRIGEGLWSQAGAMLPPATLDLVANPIQLQVRATEWLDGHPRLTLRSEAPLQADDVARLLDVAFEGEPLAYRLETAPASERDEWDPDSSLFDLHIPAWPTRSGKLTIGLRAGLRSAAGKAPGEAAPRLYATTINPPFELVDVQCRDARLSRVRGGAALPCPARSEVLLVFSREPDDAALAEFRASLPDGLALASDPRDCDYRCSDSPPQFALRLASTAVGVQQAIAVGAWRSRGGDVLVNPRRFEVAFADHAPGYRLEPSAQLVRPGDITVTPLQARNVTQRDHWVELAIGASVASRVTRLTPAAARNEYAVVPTPALDRAIARKGGLSLGGLREQAGVVRATSVAPFNLLANRDSRGVLAWATGWEGGEGLARADVELVALTLDGQQTVLARGRTDEGGAVYLPHAWSAKAPPLVVLRARHRGKVVVLPIADFAAQSVSSVSWPESDGFFDGREAAEGEVVVFGASERLLYRPGDRVRYRVWARERRGNRLLPPAATGPVEVELVDPWGPTVHDAWPATLDAWGSTAGEVTLSPRLADGLYCIRPMQAGVDEVEEQGACFEVARFETQPAWMKLAANATMLRPGESLQLDFEGGYFAGGPAAEARVRVQGLLTPVPFTQAHPDYAAYTFIEPPGDGETNPLAGATIPTQLDGKGRARLVHRLPAGFSNEDDDEDVFAFGLMQFNGFLRTPGQTENASPTAKVFYAAHDLYVGLRSTGAVNVFTDPTLGAVVLTHDGKPRPGLPVQVRIESDKQGATTVLARCTLVSGTPATCPFRAPAAGVYSAVAESDGAAPTRLQLYFGDRTPTPAAPAPTRAELEVVSASDGVRPATLRLRQPHPRATALFVVEFGHQVRHWVQEVGPETVFDLPVKADWAPGVSVRVMLRPRRATAKDTPVSGHFAPTLDAIAHVALPSAAVGQVVLDVERRELAPADTLVLKVRNDAALPRLVTLAVVDDAVHQQASFLHSGLDPAGARFLGVLDSWKTGRWFGLQGWRWLRNPFYVAGQGTELYGDQGSDHMSLDTIEVTGSRIKQSDIFEERPAMDVLLRAATAEPGAAMARVRSRFPDAAYWNPGIELAPGESRELRIELPDNLTRWRVLAWSGDAADGFSLAETTVTTSLAVELRPGLPSHLYVGDRATAAASARVNGAGPRPVQLTLAAEGAGMAAATRASGQVAPFGTLQGQIGLAPAAAGRIELLARATAGDSADAVSSSVVVHSREAAQTVSQTGWLAGRALRLPTPALPPGAHGAELILTVSQGYERWQRDWMASLREYPHRCWEQTLSRSVGAALALLDPVAAADWPQAQDEINEALRSAPSFQNQERRYLFFTPDGNDGFIPANDSLSAYTLRSFALLESLGQPVPDRLQAPLLADLSAIRWDKDYNPEDFQLDHYAAVSGAVAAAGGTPDARLLDELWQRWDDLSWYGRSELSRALASQPAQAVRARQAIDRLHQAGELRGARRVITTDRDLGAIMGSSLRDHCAVTTTLWDLDARPESLESRQQHLRGLQDLYAGGTASLDSQASAHCLLALRSAGLRETAPAGPQAVAVRQRGQATVLRMDTGDRAAHWTAPAADAPLELSPEGALRADTTYQARLSYRVDQAQVEASGTGLRLQRAYSVLRAGGWRPLAEVDVREGDWIRITLRLQVPALRHFVAITDAVPGGWATRDIRLAGVAGADVLRVADEGSWWFGTRQTGARQVRLYAETLPPGSHEVHYFAQATHAGRYFAPPAVAELMYGRASRSNTAPAQITINAAR